MPGPNPNDRLFGERMLGSAKHFLGNHVDARRHLEHVLTHYAATGHERDAIRSQDVIRFLTDVYFPARVFLARVLWLQGFSDQAVRMAEETMQEAQATGHALKQCYTLVLAACPIALWSDNLAAAARHTRMLLDLSRKHGLSHLAAYGLRYQRAIALKGGDVDSGSPPRASGLDEMAQPSAKFGSMTGLGELVEALAHAGRSAEGLAVLDEEIDQSAVTWLMPESLRLRGELLLSQGAPAAVETAESLFRQALDEALRQQALSWELRAATSLARLLRQQGRRADAVARLEAVYSRFTEGFGTADLMAAKRILDDSDHH
jgi:Tetratricopeptide repeat